MNITLGIKNPRSRVAAPVVTADDPALRKRAERYRTETYNPDDDTDEMLAARLSAILGYETLEGLYVHHMGIHGDDGSEMMHNFVYFLRDLVEPGVTEVLWLETDEPGADSFYASTAKCAVGRPDGWLSDQEATQVEATVESPPKKKGAK